jgi:hypothetical protein
MQVDRRETLRLLATLSALASTPSFAARSTPPAALLLPTTGEHASLGLSMARAAALGQPVAKALPPFDTAGRGGAAGAATLALRRGAKLILGPLFSADVRPVLTAVAGRAPVVTFSNDPALRDSGAFLLGLDPGQIADALLRYARGRGIREVAVAAPVGGAGQRVLAAATALQGELGITIRPLAAGDIATQLRARPADALLAGDGAAVAATAAQAAGVQLLLATPGLDARPETLRTAAGAWTAAPDPQAFADFATRYRATVGGEPGLLAALAYDAALLSLRVGAGGRAALLAPGGFTGATGAFRFRADGTAARDLAILVAGPDGYVAA